MSDRTEQARAEAERQASVCASPWAPADATRYGGFMSGVEWADANPKPTTITRDDMGTAYAAFMDAEGHPVRRFIVALKAAGIEVEDDDE